MANAEQTEKPTQRRLDKARKEGNFPTSREFTGAVHFAGVVILLSMFSGEFLARLIRLTRHLLSIAFTTSLTPKQFVAMVRTLIAPDLVPLIFGGFGLAVLVIAIQLGSTKLGISFAKLAPDLKRLNPLSRLAGLPA